MANRYSGRGSSGSRPKRGAAAAIRANRSASTIRRSSRKGSRSRSAKDSTVQNAVGGAAGMPFH